MVRSFERLPPAISKRARLDSVDIGKRIDRFSQETLEQLGDNYVYALIDPGINCLDPNRYFYVGKGTGQRCFQHARAEIDWIPNPDDEDPKLEIIRRIRKETGEAPPIDIVKSGLNKTEAHAIEAILIGLLRGRANLVSGHGGSDLWLRAEELDARHTAPISQSDLGASVLLVSLNGGKDSPPWPQIKPEDLAFRVLGNWVISESRASGIEYVAGVYRGLIRCVFRVDRKDGRAAYETLRRKTKSGRNQTRVRFHGERNPEQESNWVLKRIVGENGKNLTTFERQQACRVISTEGAAAASPLGQRRAFGPIARTPECRAADSFIRASHESDPFNVPTYSRSRLTFLADVIEPLGWDDRFRVATPHGTFEFTKRAFYERFPKVVLTKSYKQDRIYHSANLHFQAMDFLVNG